VLLAVAACSKERGAEGPDGVADGHERGPCYGNGTCDQGLVCYSELCVRPPGADCAKVAAKLSGYRLDNYAPRDERARVIAEIEAMCVDAQLTEDEGRCIVQAQGRSEIGVCPRPLLPELANDPSGCKGLGAHFTGLLFTEMAGQGAERAKLERYRDELTAALDASCAEDGWTEAARKCVFDASSMDDAEECDRVVPRELQRKVRARMEPLLDRIEAETKGGGATALPPATP
jgi:hypothetical protein